MAVHLGGSLQLISNDYSNFKNIIHPRAAKDNPVLFKLIFSVSTSHSHIDLGIIL